MIAYHGTKQRFNRFEWRHLGKTDEGFYGRGFYFSPTYDLALEYGDEVMKCEIDVRRTLCIPTSSNKNDISTYDCRDILSDLFGVNSNKTNRKLKDGYTLSKSGGIFTVSKFGKMISQSANSTIAIINANDIIDGVSMNMGSYTTDVIRSMTDRKNFHMIMRANDYDCLLAYDSKTKETIEYMVIHSNAIKIIG